MGLSTGRVLAAVRSPGLWLLAAGVEFLLLLHVAEFQDSTYSVSEDYVSELGVGPIRPRITFTVAVILFGVMTAYAATLMRRGPVKSRLWILLALTGVGAVGVGVFDMDNFSAAHALFALMAFVFGNVASIYSSKVVRPPLSYIFVIFGLVGLTALALFIAGAHFGIGEGGMERMILYPAMFWVMCYGGYLLADESRPSAEQA